MRNVGSGLAQLGLAVSQLCALLSQVSLAVSQSSLVLGQLSVTVSQFIVAFSQISAALSQYAFLVSQLGGLALQLGHALKRISDAVDGFSREMQRFSVCAVQFGVGFRHVALTAAQLGRAVRACVACTRAGSACRLARQASEAVCGLGVALGELAAICSLFTALNSQLVRVAGVQLVSSGGCLAVLRCAARVRQLSTGVAQLSAAVYQLSLALRHGALVAQQWALVRSASALCKQVLASLAQNLLLGCRLITDILSTRLQKTIRPLGNVARHFVSKLELILVTFGLEKSALEVITCSTTSRASHGDTLILVQNIDQNKFSNVTFIFPKELLPLLGKLWKNRREDEVLDGEGELVRFVKSRTISNSYVIALCELNNLCFQLQILDLALYPSGLPEKQFSDTIMETNSSTVDVVHEALPGSNKTKYARSYEDPSADVATANNNISPNIFVKVFTCFDCPECYPVCCYGVVGLNVLV